MGWKDDVINRFSGEQDADKWNLMYAADTDNLDDHNYRLRRDYTVDYIVNNYDKTAKLCDVGCGAGPVTFEMLRRGYDIVGLDYSKDMLDNAAKRLADGRLASGDSFWRYYLLTASWRCRRRWLCRC